jgi:hypothetical protein
MGRGHPRGSNKRGGNWRSNNSHIPYPTNTNKIRSIGWLNSCKEEEPQRYRERRLRKYKAWKKRFNQ